MVTRYHVFRQPPRDVVQVEGDTGEEAVLAHVQSNGLGAGAYYFLEVGATTRVTIEQVNEFRVKTTEVADGPPAPPA